jgi:hypothetical protein
MKTRTNSAVEVYADNMGEYFRREREVGAKARAGIATVEDYKTLGFTEAGARWLAEQGAAEEAPPLQDPAASPETETDFASFPPFSIGGRHTAYEWMMVWGDREPYAPWWSWWGIDGENPDNPDQAHARWHLMLFFAEEATLNLRRDIDAGAVPLVKRAYRRNHLGHIVLDVTRCVVSQEAILDFAERIGGFGNRIAELLALRQASARAPSGDNHHKGRPSKDAGEPKASRSHGGRRKGSGAIDDVQSLKGMLRLLSTDDATSVWDAAGKVSKSLPSGQSETANWARIYRKFRERYHVRPAEGMTWSDILEQESDEN